VDEADDLALVTHRDVVWSLPESIRSDFIIPADEIRHHLLHVDPGAIWMLPAL